MITEVKGLPFITSEQGDSNFKAVKETIRFFNGQIKDRNYTMRITLCDGVGEELFNKIIPFIRRSVVKRSSSTSGSGLAPEFNNEWVIGCFGSIWLDLMIDGEWYRVALYNNEGEINDLMVFRNH